MESVLEFASTLYEQKKASLSLLQIIFFLVGWAFLIRKKSICFVYVKILRISIGNSK